jgi:phenylpropionate dioxygenase-like ring-hydroxylating dioxygenase large terminal subunit
MSLKLDDLIRDDAVHRRAYVDEAVFALEMERIFGTTWVYVAHESELPNPGDFKTTTIGRNPVIVTKTASGAIAVMYNRCAHRALTVCEAREGNAGFFRCPYHGWTYDLAGNLTGAPFPTGYAEGFDKAAFGLQHVARVDAYRGFIFACLDANVGCLHEWLSGATEYLDAFTDAAPAGKIGARAGVHRYHYAGNWKLALEGSVDGYHPYVLHKSFFDWQSQRSGKRSDMYSREGSTSYVAALPNGHALGDSRKEFLGSNVFYERTRMSPGGPALIAELEQSYGADGTKQLLSEAGGMGFNLMVFPNLILIQAQIRVVFPVAVDRTNVEVRPTTLEGVPAKVNQMRLRSHELFHGPAGFGGPDDLEAFNRTQRGLQAAEVEWLDFARGRHREQVEADRIVGQITDETHQRGIYRQWLRLMRGAATVGAR